MNMRFFFFLLVVLIVVMRIFLNRLLNGGIDIFYISGRTDTKNDCAGFVNHWVWKNTSHNIVPLFGCSKDNSTNDKKTFNGSKCNQRGYIFAGNHYGGIYYNPSNILQFELGSTKCHFKVYQDRDKNIFTKNNLWIHVEGDSVMRDIYYDFKEYFTKMYRPRVKIPHSHSFYINGTLLSFSSNPGTFTFPCKGLKTWKLYTQEYNRSYPDVWIYNTGLHDIAVFNTTNNTYVQKMRCLNTFVDNRTLAIFRLTTPTGKNLDHRPVRYRVAELNKIALNELDTRLWNIFDAYYLLYNRRNELRVDGMHYSGVGSKWMTNMLLDIIQKRLHLK